MDRIREVMKSLGLSNADIARISGKSTSSISQILNGNYKGRPEILDEILAALKAHQSRISETEANARVQWESDGQKLMMSVLQLTYATQGLGVVVGPSGIGKTYMTTKFHQMNPDTAYMRCSDGMSMGDVVDALLELTSLPCYGSNSQRMKKAIRGLKDRGIRMLLVDEADLLVTDGSKPKILKKISVFREVKEAGIGVALIGLETFDTALRVVGETYVTSRIELLRKVPNVSKKDLEYYISTLGFDPENEGPRQAVALAPRNGSFRFVQKAAGIAMHLGGNMIEALSVLFASSDHVKHVKGV